MHQKYFVIITLYTCNLEVLTSYSLRFSDSLAGVSRSITILMAYLMSVTTLNWKEALKCVRVVRTIANPNLGFQRQLQEFEGRRLREVSGNNRKNGISILRLFIDSFSCIFVNRKGKG